MGNCFVGGTTGDRSLVRVATPHGGVMEFRPPITVESIADEFPGHGIFRSHDLFRKPLPHKEILVAGELYHLLPLRGEQDQPKGVPGTAGHVRSRSEPPQMSQYRMSFHSRGLAKRSPEQAADPKSGNGFWQVKLVISPDQLLEILSEDGKTETLIESVRTVAKCGSGSATPAVSDQWTLSGSKNAAASTKADLSPL